MTADSLLILLFSGSFTTAHSSNTHTDTQMHKHTHTHLETVSQKMTYLNAV